MHLKSSILMCTVSKVYSILSYLNKKPNMMSVARTRNNPTYLAVLAIILPSPIARDVTVQAEMILLRQTPLPAEAPTT